MPNEFWAAIAGAVVGALVTGIISYIVQLNAQSVAKKQREQDTKEKSQALGHSLLLKMIRIHSTIYQLNYILKKSVQN